MSRGPSMLVYLPLWRLLSRIQIFPLIMQICYFTGKNMSIWNYIGIPSKKSRWTSNTSVGSTFFLNLPYFSDICKGMEYLEEKKIVHQDLCADRVMISEDGKAKVGDDVMMTSSNGNIFHVTGPLWGEFTGHRWLPRTKDSDAELWCFPWSAPE